MGAACHREPAAEDDVPKAANASSSRQRAEVTVVVGSSQHSGLVQQIASMANAAYGYRRLSAEEVAGRLTRGDSVERANRVLHLAFIGQELVGCVSSTYSVPWTQEGCGHWGLLAVDPSAQGCGVASALVEAAESRLRQGGCYAVQIEYEYAPGDAASERLRGWYEGKLGFASTSSWVVGRFIGMVLGHKGGVQFRRCQKKL
mmetsp:Transcript_68621/g.127995  ORF Transcript_68621/g.127995 Transcript_68621/m.127995 type:complete len:202 (-) Transcript_68621:129-734(-)